MNIAWLKFLWFLFSLLPVGQRNHDNLHPMKISRYTVLLYSKHWGSVYSADPF